MPDALAEMSAKGLGCVVIVDARGHVAGIITDGDLRRKMRADLLSASVEEIMTANPRTVRREALASEALEILNSAKITTLIVTDGLKPVGILHMHDLLRAGVA
jgi:arabinose-5-phosphate isomerase